MFLCVLIYLEQINFSIRHDKSYACQQNMDKEEW